MGGMGYDMIPLNNDFLYLEIPLQSAAILTSCAACGVV